MLSSLGIQSTSRKQKSEALPHKGRNQKTRWQTVFTDLETVHGMRKGSTEPRIFLLDSMQFLTKILTVICSMKCHFIVPSDTDRMSG